MIDPAERHPVWRELDDLTRHRLLKAMREPLDEEGEFLAEIWTGSCVHCGSENTMDLCDIEGIENAVVGLCKDCGGMWCTECRAPIETPDLECGHFAVCEECGLCESFASDLEDEDFGDGEPCGPECGHDHPEFCEDECGFDCGSELDIEPIHCERIRGWLIEKGYFTREELDQYDQAQGLEFYGEAMLFCGWCKRPFDFDGTIYTSRLELKPGLELEGEEGLVVPLRLISAERTVPAVFFSLPSSDGRWVKGLNVMTCSEECLEALREAFDREREIFERFNVN